jgi:hypothetical protein
MDAETEAVAASAEAAGDEAVATGEAFGDPKENAPLGAAVEAAVGFAALMLAAPKPLLAPPLAELPKLNPPFAGAAAAVAVDPNVAFPLPKVGAGEAAAAAPPPPPPNVNLPPDDTGPAAEPEPEPDEDKDPKPDFFALGGA